MGEAEIGPQQGQIDRAVTPAFRGSVISADGGLRLYRELDDRARHRGRRGAAAH